MSDTSAPAGGPASAAPAPAQATAPAPGAAGPASANPEALDQIIETTKPRGWLALWAIAAAVAIALVWSIVATIPLQVANTGVVSAFAYTVDVSAPADGAVGFEQDIARDVTEGEEIATITPFDGKPPVKVLAPASGQVQGIFVDQGQGVTAGTRMATVVRMPDLSSDRGIVVVTYVTANDAMNYNEGQSAQVTVTNIATSVTNVVSATIGNVANSPSSLEGMTNITGSQSLSEQWMKECDGAPFRVVLNITDWQGTNSSDLPAPGQVVQIVNTYGEVHPIQMLFGGN